MFTKKRIRSDIKELKEILKELSSSLKDCTIEEIDRGLFEDLNLITANLLNDYLDQFEGE